MIVDTMLPGPHEIRDDMAVNGRLHLPLAEETKMTLHEAGVGLRSLVTRQAGLNRRITFRRPCNRARNDGSPAPAQLLLACPATLAEDDLGLLIAAVAHGGHGTSDLVYEQLFATIQHGAR